MQMLSINGSGEKDLKRVKKNTVELKLFWLFYLGENHFCPG